MIIKIQDDNLHDKHVVEATYIRWLRETTYYIMEVYIIAKEAKTAGSVSQTITRIEDRPSLRLKINHGDRVFIMNDEGKTVDSKRVIKIEEDYTNDGTPPYGAVMPKLKRAVSCCKRCQNTGIVSEGGRAGEPCPNCKEERGGFRTGEFIMKVEKALNELKDALKETRMQDNTLVTQAFELIEKHISLCCDGCDGQGKVRVWYAPR